MRVLGLFLMNLRPDAGMRYLLRWPRPGSAYA